MIALPALAWSLIARFWQYGAIVALAALAWHFDARAVANADALREQAASFSAAQKSAAALAQAALHHTEATYQAKAMEADHAYSIALADAQTAADRYIAGHRVPVGGVQPAPAGGDASPAPAAAPGDSAGVSASVPGDAVVVSASDVQACTSATTYALKAHDWAVGLAIRR